MNSPWTVRTTPAVSVHVRVAFRRGRVICGCIELICYQITKAPAGSGGGLVLSGLRPLRHNEGGQHARTAHRAPCVRHRRRIRGPDGDQQTSARRVRRRARLLADRSGGKEISRFHPGLGSNCLGHCPTAIVSAIKSQAEQLLNCSPAYYNAPMIRLAELIARYSGLHRTFFTNSGAEAIEGAIKLARKWGQIHRGGAYEIVTMHHGFHGRTLAAMSASGKAQWEQLFEPKVRGFRKVRLNDIEQVERAITANTVAVMLEPIQGEAGVFVASDAFLRDLRALTKRHGILLILDEIQTGIGRTGTLFAFQHAGIEPDVMVLAKGLGSGEVRGRGLLLALNLQSEIGPAGGRIGAAARACSASR